MRGHGAGPRRARRDVRLMTPAAPYPRAASSDLRSPTLASRLARRRHPHWPETRRAFDARSRPGAEGRRAFRVTTDSAHRLARRGEPAARQFAPAAPHRAGPPTSPRCRPARAGVIWPSCSTSARDASSAGPCDRHSTADLVRGAACGARLASGAAAASLGSRRPVRELRVSRPARATRHYGQHEPCGQLLGQCHRRELLQLAESRTALAGGLAHTRRSGGRRRQLPPLLQSSPPTFSAQLSQPGRV